MSKLARQLVASTSFEVFSGTLIVASAIFAAVQADFGTDYHLPFTLTDYAFSAAFFFELLLRLSANGFDFFVKKDLYWDYFDLFVVSISCGEAVASLVKLLNDPTGQAGTFAYMRILRIIRVCRAVRILRILRFLRPLRLLVASMAYTAKSLLWAFLLLCVIVYMFAVAFQQATSEYLSEQGLYDSTDKDAMALRTHFSTFGRCCFSFFGVAVFSGMEVLTQSLAVMHWSYAAAFIFYICIVRFALMNVMTGAFCSKAIENARNDHDGMVQAQIEAKESYVQLLKSLFDEIDTDHTHHLTLGQLQQAIKNPKVQAFFSALDLDETDAWTIFKFLDAEQRGSLDIDEFVQGCLHVRGNVSNIEFKKMMFENEGIKQTLHRFKRDTERQLNDIAIRLAAPRKRVLLSAAHARPTGAHGCQPSVCGVAPSLGPVHNLPGVGPGRVRL